MTTSCLWGFALGATSKTVRTWSGRIRGVCTFDYIESETQAARFNEVYPGDLVVLKKREKFGETMKLFGHGRVKSIAYNDAGNRYLVMEWSGQDGIIEVPLLGCNSTVDIRSMEVVQKEMPEEFFEWLEK
jgi:hypothetical protein